MEYSIEMVLYIICGVLLGLILAVYYVLSQKNSYQRSDFASKISLLEVENTQLKSDLNRSQLENRDSLNSISALREEMASVKARNIAFAEQIVQQKSNETQEAEKIKTIFENIANKILDEKQEKFAKVGSKEIRDILDPLGREIKEFKSQIEKNHIAEVEKRASLSTELQQLMTLNKQLSDDAVSLTKALKGDKNSKVQGDWGEMILESILTNSGLEKDKHYFTQLNQKSAEGLNQRPDVIVKYPDGREIIIDSKVSLTAYSRYVDCDSEEEREKALAEHILSIKRHVDELCAKEYDKRDDSLDFVMMFMPIETSYILALGKDTLLWDYAYKRRVILITPTHLITALKLVYDLWKREIQNQNVKKIVERGVLMYEKFNGFVVEMEDIDNSLKKCRISYDKAMDRLKNGKGNLISQAKELQKLGVKSAKTDRIVQIESSEEDDI